MPPRSNDRVARRLPDHERCVSITLGWPDPEVLTVRSLVAEPKDFGWNAADVSRNLFSLKHRHRIGEVLHHAIG